MGSSAGILSISMTWVDVNLWFMKNNRVSGIFNVGTGRSRSFNDIARLLIDWHAGGRVQYLDFPEDLLDAYQSFTEADISALREAGYRKPFTGLELGIRKYLEHMEAEYGNRF